MDASAISELARQVPSLALAPGIDPLLPDEQDAWAVAGASHGQKQTARFILSLCDVDHAWRAGPFLFADAWRVWDTPHKTVFVRWAQQELLRETKDESFYRSLFESAKDSSASID